MTTEQDNTQNLARSLADSFFGGCPVCGGHDGHLNIGRDHWMVCHTHKTKWCRGSDLFSTWRGQAEEEWEENTRLLADYTNVEPVWPDRCPEDDCHVGVREEEDRDEEEWVQVGRPINLRELSEKGERAPLFDVGRVVATPASLALLTMDEIAAALNRHERGNWGDVAEEDWEANDVALLLDERLLSSYLTGDGTKFWVITEADRSVTTVLLPEEY